MLRAAFRWASPTGPSARLSILIYHRVHRTPDPLFPGEVDAKVFDRQCQWLKSWFDVLPLDRAVRLLARGELPARAASITFDDGYADNHDVALPILQRHGLSATFFIATGFLDGGRMWNDTVIEAVRRCRAPALDLARTELAGLGPLALGDDGQRRAAAEGIIRAIKYRPPVERQALVDAVADTAAADLPTGLMMRSDQVHALHRAGMQIGPHTRSHPILARLDRAAAIDEVAGSREQLEDITGAPMPVFAYPNGKPGEDYSAETVAIVRELGFEAAVSTAWGAARYGADPFQLPRFTPWDRSQWRFGLRLLRNLAQA